MNTSMTIYVRGGSLQKKILNKTNMTINYIKTMREHKNRAVLDHLHHIPFHVVSCQIAVCTLPQEKEANTQPIYMCHRVTH